MGQLLEPLNYEELNIVERTEVASDAAAGQALLTLKNVDGFAVDDYVRCGSGEQAEIKQIQSLSGETLTFTSNLTFKHDQFEEVVKIRGNKIKIYRASNVDGSLPADSSFSVLTTIDIQGDQETSSYYDPTGGSDYWYKKTYYNSTSLSETALASAEPYRGGDYGHYCSIEDIKNESGLDQNFQEHITQAYVRRDQVESQVKGAITSAGYALPLTDSTDAEYVPPIIENIVRIMTGGYIQMQHYGPTGGSGYEEGDKKVKKGEDLLMQLQDSKFVLVDRYGQQMDRTDTVSGWPDSTTKCETEDNAGGKRMFSVKKIF